MVKMVRTIGSGESENFGKLLEGLVTDLDIAIEKQKLTPNVELFTSCGPRGADLKFNLFCRAPCDWNRGAAGPLSPNKNELKETITKMKKP